MTHITPNEYSGPLSETDEYFRIAVGPIRRKPDLPKTELQQYDRARSFCRPSDNKPLTDASQNNREPTARAKPSSLSPSSPNDTDSSPEDDQPPDNPVCLREPDQQVSTNLPTGSSSPGMDEDGSDDDIEDMHGVTEGRHLDSLDTRADRSSYSGGGTRGRTRCWDGGDLR